MQVPIPGSCPTFLPPSSSLQGCSQSLYWDWRLPRLRCGTLQLDLLNFARVTWATFLACSGPSNGIPFLKHCWSWCHLQTCWECNSILLSMSLMKTWQSTGPSKVPWRTLLVTGFHWLLLVTAMNCAILPRHIAGSYLTNSIWEDVNNFLMGCCYNALPIDFNDPMANTHTSSLCYASSHKATDLEGKVQVYHGLDKKQRLLITHFCLQAMNQHLNTDTCNKF